MGTAGKEKKDKPKKHKHKHKEKAPGRPEEQQRQQDKAKKKHKQQQQEAAAAAAAGPAAPIPAAAAAAAAAGATSSPSSSSDDVIMTQQRSAQHAKTAAAVKPSAATTPTVNISSSDDEEDSDSDSDIEMQQPPAAAAADAAAAAAANRQAAGVKKAAKGKAAAAAGGKSLSEVLQAEGLLQCEVVGAQCDLDLQGIQNSEHKELWVLRLPDGVSVDSLAGRRIHIPQGALPEARHLQPPPNPFHDPRADLLTYVQSAVPTQEVGHMSIGAQAAHSSLNHQRRELLQAHEFEAMTYSVIAAVPPAAAAAGGSSGSSSSKASQLRLLKVGRFIHLASDTALVDKKRMRQVSNAGAEVWGAKDGWDGILLPRHKPRRRLAGWEVQGERRHGSNGSSEDEEFEEVVFLQPGKTPDKTPTSSDPSDSDSDSEPGTKHGQHSSKGQQQGLGGAGGELYPRFYSDEGSDSETEALDRQLQGAEEDRALPGGMEAPFAADLQQWVLSLPVTARTQMLQNATAQLYSTEQWAADRRAWWARPPQNAYLAPSNAAAQEQLLQKLADMRSSSSKGSSDSSSSESESESEDDSDDVRMTPDESSPSGGDASINPDDIIVVEELGVEEEGEGEEGGATAATARLASGAAVPAYAADEAQKEYPCGLPLSYLVTLPQQVEDALAAIKGVRRRQRMRNAAVLLFTDWREVWLQVDKQFLGDDELWQLVQALPSPLRQQIQVEVDRERLRRVQARKQAAKTLGQQMVVVPPGPRPRFTATDQGYAPYQAAGERRVAASNQGASTDAEDAAVAAWLVDQGAGQRVKLLGADELRNRGFDWDTDPQHLRREGLHVVLPDGRDVHIPAGTDLDWQGELRKAWGFEGRGRGF